MPSSATLRHLSEIQFLKNQSSGGTNGSPIRYTAQMPVKQRAENDVRTIPASGSLVVTLADEGITDLSFLRILCTTKGKPFEFRMDGALTGGTVKPCDAEAMAYLHGTFSLTSFEIVNPDNAATIDVEITMAQYEAPTP